MIVIYTTPGCVSCRKAKNWLKERNIDFIEKNIYVSLLSDFEIKYLLSRCDNGTDDIISKRSKVLKENNINLDEMNISQLIDFVRNNPSVLKRPILIDDKALLVGYDEEEIEIFERGDFREYLQTTCLKEKCPNYQVCYKNREE